MKAAGKQWVFMTLIALSAAYFMYGLLVIKLAGFNSSYRGDASSAAAIMEGCERGGIVQTVYTIPQWQNTIQQKTPRCGDTFKLVPLDLYADVAILFLSIGGLVWCRRRLT